MLDPKKAQVFGICEKSQHHIVTTVMGSVVYNKSSGAQGNFRKMTPVRYITDTTVVIQKNQLPLFSDIPIKSQTEKIN